MKVPLLDLNAQFKELKEEVNIAISDVLESQSFIMGDFVKKFESEVGSYCETDFAYGCASGSDALLLALMAIDIVPGDYVITSPFTFFATAGAVTRLGAIPIFIDIDPDSFNIDPGKVRDFIEGRDELSKRLNLDRNKIKAIIPVHLYGQVAEMDALVKIAEEFNLTIIEDAAQSIGSVYRGKKAGNFGDFGCFSFFPSKNLGAYGDAGLITVKDPEIASKVDILRLHGAKPKYHHKMVGINSRLDAIQAAILSVKLNYLDDWSEKRREKALIYNELFSSTGVVTDNIADNNGVKLPKEGTGNPERGGKHIYHQYTIRVSDRDRVQGILKGEGIGTSIYYPVPLHIQECFSDLNYTSNDCPEAVRATHEALSLPIFPELTEDQIKKVVNTIAKALS
ncbi:MAG: DegT/DnrJ/EryC1/StrS family aminotransferase [Balneolaceae bacterium]